MALLKASQVLRRPKLLQRADGEMAAAWLQREPDNPDALRTYEVFIRTAIERRISPRTSSRQTLIEHGPAIAVLLDRADATFWSWLEQRLTNDVRISNLDLMDQFPLLELANALMTRRVELGLALWKKLKDAMHEGIVKISDLAYLPFVALGGMADTACNDVLESVVNDQEVADVARQAGKHGRMVWLIDKVLELARSGEAASLAKSMTLLGFADESEAADAAWYAIDALVPRGGWLDDVYQMSRHVYDRNRWARHWYRRLLEATTESEVLAAHMLLRGAIDVRAVDWIDPQQLSEFGSSRRRFWELNTRTLDAASKKRRDKLKETLFWTKTMAQTQWPWL